MPGIRTSVVATWKAGRYVQPAARFTHVTARPVLDTRNGTGTPQAAVGADQSLVLTVPGLPSNTTAVTLNGTATRSTKATFIVAYPASLNRRSGSLLNTTPAHRC